ncbi:chromosomal replication initiator protein DnaA [Pseudoflavonifractor phocaeensis]|uniref:chromosomal replication initiator protein DnaA n=1 Tax=Pseudoflavonifractor phocaeensis TaxID=1870988 RepID=UPI0019593C68|nr:chromosomal replication initiator protein DnaA [Pseudoflavonifractor phocaeensis]MBM6871407.1 chromosomal replication initiator protein DnaA [Pseudoflavonifractor phocaeensis]MBM6939062.1 chromosomal replication initiator protein DnaA [Pseudoflavonifractor phocaeensis]
MNSPADVWAMVLKLMEADMTATTINTWFDDAKAVSLDAKQFVLYTPSNFKRDIILSRYLPAIQKALHELFSADLDVLVLGEGELERFTAANQPPADDNFLPGTEDYTFERFVVGSSNKMAYAAARAVAEKPAHSYNPLFIYGESGLGKTHLLYAIAHTIHRTHPEFRVVYIKGDAFTNDLIQAIREGRNPEFRNKYRSADVFLMDDVQFIAGRESSQEEMFHTFNTLYEAGRQIVFTADRPPKEMLRLDDRLRTRFEWGLPVDIQPPDYETRVAIIKNKAIRRGINLPEPVLQYIADNITSNVRQIEGTVNKILAFQELMGESVDVDTVIRTVRDMCKDKAEFLPSPDVIIEEVAKFYNLDTDAIRGQGRTKDTALARQIAMYQIRRMTNLSLKEIGKEFEGRDHTTVMHSIDRVEKLMKTNPEIAEIIKDINANINAHYDN